MTASGSPFPQDPFFVAELSANHNGSLATALETLEAAALAGAHAIKLQTYTADTMTMNIDNEHFKIRKDHSLWGGKNLYELYAAAHTPWDWHQDIFDKAEDLGLTAFSTPFDVTAVDFLESIDNPIYKIASIEIRHHPLIAKAAQTGKPLVISTGASTPDEIGEAIDVAKANGASEIVLLVCTSSYPAEPQDSHLARIPLLSSLFGLPVGLSDHTLGIGTSISGIALGAVLVERHVTLARKSGGFDANFSVEPAEFQMLVEEGNAARLAVGRDDVWNLESESESRRLRPSIYVSKDIRAGETVSVENIRVARPAGGLEPRFFAELFGRVFVSDLVAGTPVSWNVFESNENI